jgi:D-3-phosphoglycerate dehydrogenase
VPDFSTEEVADHTMALLLSAARRLKYYETSMRAGFQPHDMDNMHRLSTCTLGLIGFGKIAQAVARRAMAFGMRIVASDPRGAPADGTFTEVEFCGLDKVLKEADYLSLLCPLSQSTRGMIGADEFAAMKRSAVLINTGRGELVDEATLAKALQEGIIRYAAIDVFGQINVFARNGFATSHALFSLDNVQLTPHVAAYSQEAMEEVHQKAAQAVVDVLSGRLPLNLVNPELINCKDN